MVPWYGFFFGAAVSTGGLYLHLSRREVPEFRQTVGAAASWWLLVACGLGVGVVLAPAFASWGAELPLPTQLWLDSHGFLARSWFVTTPVLTFAVAEAAERLRGRFGPRGLVLAGLACGLAYLSVMGVALTMPMFGCGCSLVE